LSLSFKIEKNKINSNKTDKIHKKINCENTSGGLNSVANTTLKNVKSFFQYNCCCKFKKDNKSIRLRTKKEERLIKYKNVKKKLKYS
jgi:site-specific recombinase XerD